MMDEGMSHKEIHPLKIAIYAALAVLILIPLNKNRIVKFLSLNNVESAPAVLTEEETEYYLTQIGRTYRPSFELNCYIMAASSERFQIRAAAYEAYRSMGTHERYIMFAGGSHLNGDLYPQEIYGLFDVYLFLMGKEIPFQVAVVDWYYSSGGIDNTHFFDTQITPAEFQDYYTRYQSDIEGMSRRKAAKFLGGKWIEETGYVKE